MLYEVITIVLESEMAALEIINYAQDNNLEIGINYCSFFFKNRFQAAGYRKTLAENLHSEKENITEKGYIRNIHDNKLSYSSYSRTLLLCRCVMLPCACKHSMLH